MTAVLWSMLASPLVLLLLVLFAAVVLVAVIVERPPRQLPSLRDCCPTDRKGADQ